MSVASEVHTSLRTMGFAQLLLAVVFLACYSVACSTLFEARGRGRAAFVALVAAVAFTVLMQPWVHGALLVAAAVAGMGVFSIAVWVMGTVLQIRQGRLPTEEALLASEAAEPAVPELATAAPQAMPSHRDGIHAA